MPDLERPFDMDKWMTEIRDPANAAAEEPRVLAVTGATASYQLAPLPDGRFAVKVRCAYDCGDCHGVGIPWRAFPTREACVAFFFEQARSHFGMEVSGRVAGTQGKARAAMQEVLRREEHRASGEPEPVQGLFF